mmetsp:Transcript_45417/g.117518  ORF Transcript_45417/g.117518 Transcript_45417/m.117518 type:complete len:150 (-) Transcript_45417:103-552(-)
MAFARASLALLARPMARPALARLAPSAPRMVDCRHADGAAARWAFGAARTFCAGSGSVEERVIKAVKRYAQMRVDELQKEEGSSGEMLAKLKGEISAATKWDELGFDDLDTVEVLLEVEDEFGHVIPDDNADAIHNVKDTIEYIQKHCS